MPLDVYLGVVAATNMKQRTRKQIEYYHADRLNYAVLGTPNRLEYDQGFFVKNGDGAADIKPLAHLYKTQVYRARRASRPAGRNPLAPADDRHLVAGAEPGGVLLLRSLRRRWMCASSDWRTALPADAVAERAGLTAEQVEAVWRDIKAKRSATRYLHEPPLLVEEVLKAP